MKTLQQKKQREETTTAKLEGLEWLPVVLDLHAQIHDELPSEKKHSLIVRGMDYFIPLLDPCCQDAALMGVFDHTGTLVGMCSLSLQKDWEHALATQMITCDGDLSHILEADQRFAVVQSLCLTERTKGKGLGAYLIQDTLAWAKQQGVCNVFAQVAHDNPCSWVQFMKQGFDLVFSWTSGHGRYLLHTNGQRHSKQVKKSCLASKDEFYVGAAAHDDWISLFESHLAQHGRISYNYKHTQSKLLCFDLVT